jgi:hypothetical protein
MAIVRGGAAALLDEFLGAVMPAWPRVDAMVPALPWKQAVSALGRAIALPAHLPLYVGERSPVSR